MALTAKLTAAALLLAAFVAPIAAAPPAADIVPAGFVRLRTDPALGELWSARVGTPSEPVFCVRDGLVVCVLYSLSKVQLAANSSWHHVYGLDGLPPVADINVLYRPAGDGGEERFDLVLRFE